MDIKVATAEYVPPVKENPLTDIVAEHVAEAETNPNAARIITVPVEDATKAQLLYQKAANELNKTAKLRIKDESKVKAGKPDENGDIPLTGDVSLTFTITARNKARRNKNAEAAKAEAAQPTEADSAE